MQIIEPRVRIETPDSHIADFPVLLERFGRACHRTENRMREGGADDFIRKYFIELGHESVLEHCAVTVRFTCDRTASHQLVRHRIGSYSQESQRAVDYSDTGIQVICPPSIRENADLLKDWTACMERLEAEYRRLVESGVPPEDARSVLPNCTKTEVVATFNLRQWRHIFIQRALNPKAQWQIRRLMADLLKMLTERLPAVFEDLQREILYKLVFESPERWED